MMILLTGGSGCGKSHFAEELCGRLPGKRYYIAAMKPYGEGAIEKVMHHREMRREKAFETIECYTDMESLQLPEKGTALLECICNLTANEMFDSSGHVTDPYEKVMAGVNALESQSENIIIVTNDVGGDMLEYSNETREYIKAMGRINADLARRADTVIEMVAGIPLYLKGKAL